MKKVVRRQKMSSVKDPVHFACTVLLERELARPVDEI